MKKKFITAGIVAIILFFSTTFCYATQDGDNKDAQTMDLGNQITESMNKIERSAENLTNNIKNNEMVNNMKDGINNVEKDMMNGMNNIGNNVRSDYDAARTSAQTTLNNTTEMTETTWIWIVLGVVGIVILATVWFYAMQNSSND